MWHNFRRILNYYRLNLIFDLKANIAYPTTFWFASLAIPFWVSVQILLIETIYGQTETFLGYSKYENYVLFGTFKLVQSTATVFFMQQLYELADKIRGISGKSFDAILIKPIDSQLYATTGKYWFGSISAALAGVGMVVYGLVHEPHLISFSGWAMYVSTVLLGVFLLYILYLFIQTWIFWFEYLEIGLDLWFTFQGFGQYPRGLYTGWASGILNIVIPITLMAGVPVDFLFGRIPLIT
jgi:ABC-type uncharacterized transport system permease subunit